MFHNLNLATGHSIVQGSNEFPEIRTICTGYSNRLQKAQGVD